MLKRLHLYISGRVQGVSFRAFARDKAKSMDLVGYAKNLPDGQVEILVEGEDAQIDAFLKLCQHGPVLAHVQSVDIQEMPVGPGEYSQFTIRY